MGNHFLPAAFQQNHVVGRNGTARRPPAPARRALAHSALAAQQKPAFRNGEQSAVNRKNPGAAQNGGNTGGQQSKLPEADRNRRRRPRFPFPESYDESVVIPVQQQGITPPCRQFGAGTAGRRLHGNFALGRCGGNRIPHLSAGQERQPVQTTRPACGRIPHDQRGSGPLRQYQLRHSRPADLRRRPAAFRRTPRLPVHLRFPGTTGRKAPRLRVLHTTSFLRPASAVSFPVFKQVCLQ